MAKTRVLVVDDDTMIRQILSRTLINAGFECHVEKDGHSALDFLGEEVPDIIQETRTLPDIILLDINLPDITGIEVCKIIKKTLNE